MSEDQPRRAAPTSKRRSEARGAVSPRRVASSSQRPQALGFVVSMVLLVLFFDWVSRQMGHPMKAALTVAISQMLLVDVDYVLSGKRGLAAGAASATAEPAVRRQTSPIMASAIRRLMKSIPRNLRLPAGRPVSHRLNGN